MSEECKKRKREDKKKKENVEQLNNQETQQTDEGKSYSEGTKKGRKRLKGLYKRLVDQLEFYFSDANLRKDGFLMQLIKKDPWVELTVFENFNKLKTMMADLVEDGNSVQHHLARALEVKKSSMLVVSEDGTKVKRLTQVQEKEDIEECTIYVENIAPDATHELIKKSFSEFGAVAYVSIPKFHKSQKAKGFAFIEFEKKESVTNVIKACGVNLEETMLPDPASLASIRTFNEGDEDANKYDILNKRKLENEDDDFDAPKRLRIDENQKKPESAGGGDDGADNLTASLLGDSRPEGEDINIKSLHGLRILTKTQWRRLRNQYLNQQRKYVSRAKALLRKETKENRPVDSQAEPAKEATTKSKAEASGQVSKHPLEFTKGLILKFTVPGGIDDVKVCKKKVRELEDVGYIDATIGHEHFYVRCRTAEEADKLEKAALENWTGVKLKDKEEADYWLKIQKDMADKKSGKVVVPKSKKKKKKIIASMEERRNSHVHFSD